MKSISGRRTWPLLPVLIVLALLILLSCWALSTLDRTVSLPSGVGKTVEVTQQDTLLGLKGYWPYASGIMGGHQFLVNLNNGNLIVQIADRLVSAPGFDSLVLRTYNSLNVHNGEFGVGWTSNLGNTVRLVFQEDGRVAYYGISGGVEIFTPQADGYAAPPGFFSILAREADGSFTLTGIADGLKYIFDSSGRLTGISDRNGNTEQYVRDRDGQVTEVIDSAGRRTAASYNRSRLILTLRDSAGRATEYQYDAVRRLISATNLGGGKTEYSYDAAGRLSGLGNVGGGRWTFRYDDSGRVVSIANPLGQSAQFEYAEGVTVVTDANQHAVTYHMDQEGKVTDIVNANGYRYVYSWDADRNVSGITTPANNQNRFTWQPGTGLLASITDALGNVISYTYDSNFNLSTITDARGSVTQFGYDASGANLISVTQADGSQFTFGYDEHGNLVTQTDPNGNARHPSNPEGLAYRFVYNDYSYLTEAYDPLGNHWTYTWDNDTGNLLSLQDAKGQSTRYAYDALDQLTSTTYADGKTVRFNYDSLGNLTSMEEDYGTTAFTYDGAGRLVSEDDPRSDGLTRYEYDPAGNLMTLTQEDGSVLKFSYDAGDRLVSQTNPFDGGKSILYAYDENDQLTGITYPNGDQTTYGYYANGWLVSLLTKASNGTVYNRYEFPSPAQGGYDQNGNPLSLTRTIAIFDEEGKLDWTTETWKMKYDSMDRLVDMARYDANGVWKWHISFAYNPNGLWARRTYDDDTQNQSWDYQYDAASRWIGIAYWDGLRVEVRNDANGNQIEFVEQFKEGEDASPNIVSVTTSFEYDAADRLTRVTDTEGNWHTFAYNGFDQIVEVNSNEYSKPKLQYYDLLGMARETQGLATIHYVNDLAGNVRAAAIVGTPSYYLHRDPRGQITHVSDELREYFDYCPVGNVMAEGASSGGAVYEPFLSTGLYAVVVDGTFQAGMLLSMGDGRFWAHNAQVDTQNKPVAPSMRNVAPSTMDNFDEFLISFLKEMSGFDPDDPCLKNPYSEECRRETLKKFLKKAGEQSGKFKLPKGPKEQINRRYDIDIGRGGRIITGPMWRKIPTMLIGWRRGTGAGCSEVRCSDALCLHPKVYPCGFPK